MGLFDRFKKGEKEASRLDGGKISMIVHEPSIDDIEQQIIPIENRMRSERPVYNDLYAHEILILSYAEKFNVSQTQFQGFWWYKYGIKDARAIIDSLIRRGYLRVGGIETGVRVSTAAELKAFLQTQGIKTTGKKADLVARILIEADPRAVEAAFAAARTFELTDAGAEAVSACSAIPYAHAHPEIRRDIWTVTQELTADPERMNKITFNECNAEFRQHLADGDYGLAASSSFAMARAKARLGKYQSAIRLLCLTISLDLTGAGNNYQPNLYFRITAKYLFPEERSILTIGTALPPVAFEWADKAGLSDEETERLLLEGFTEARKFLPIELFTPDECVDLLYFAAKGDEEGTGRVFSIAKERFYRTYPHAAPPAED